MEEYLIYKNCDLRNRPNIQIGKGAVIQESVWIDARGKVIIGEGSNISRRCVIGSGKLVKIGKKVLLGPNVYLNDIGHSFEDVTKSIMEQGITNPRTVKIGDGAWIGINSAVMASVGKNSIIGANSTVTKDIPDFSLAVGSPAKVIKYYDFKKKAWVKNTLYRRLIKKICHLLKVTK